MTSFLLIDPQYSFMDDAELPVTGAYADMDRVTDFLKNHSEKLDDIRVTLDSHRSIHIANPIYWVDKNGNHPKHIGEAIQLGDPSLAIITKDKVSGKNPEFRTTNPAWKEHGVNYVNSLPDNFPLTIWNPHCLIGSKGASVYQPLHDELIRWENENFAAIDWITKGANMHTEHYGAVRAEVPLPEDPETDTNSSFANFMEENDSVLVAGEAITHCVLRSIQQIGEEFGDEYIKKIVLLEDGSSPIVGFEQIYQDFKDEMIGKGMKVSSTIDFF